MSPLSRFTICSSRLIFKRFYSAANITVQPKCGLIDEDVKIKVSNLNQNEKVTILATSIGPKLKWQCHAYYQANKIGLVDMSSDLSYGGDYVGKEPMGLFWAQKLSPGFYCTASSPDFRTSFVVLLEVFQGHHNIGNLTNLQSICSIEVDRVQKTKLITRIPVDDGNIRGILFVPEDSGVYPAIIDIRGEAGLTETRAALLASKGFVTLALAHSGYDDLPDDISVVDLEYFKEAVDFILGHKKVQNVGVLGSSLGGTIALAMSGCIPNIKSVVLISSSIFPPGRQFKFRKTEWEAVKMDSTKLTVTDDTLNSANVFPQFKSSDVKKYMPRFEYSKASILSIESEDDGLGHPTKKHNLMKEIFSSSGKMNYKFLEYEGAGHFLDVPYLPLIGKAFFNKKHRMPTWFGGNPEQHANAQKQAWSEIINFFRSTL